MHDLTVSSREIKPRVVNLNHGIIYITPQNKQCMEEAFLSNVKLLLNLNFRLNLVAKKVIRQL